MNGSSAITLAPVTLILGGARSGKSRHAEQLVLAAGKSRVYLATSEARDPEMAARIEQHRERRGDGWRTVEEPLNLATALIREAQAGRPVLVDCLTLWLANLIEDARDIEAETAALIAALPDLTGPVVFVSNEVGQGIVPDNPLARRFRDEAGRLHQALAAAADQVIFVTAGIATRLK